MLGRKYAFLASTALVASLALAACDSNNAPAVVQDVDPVAGPLGLSLGEAVAVMSADANMHLVRVSDQHSTVTLNTLDIDPDTGDVTAFSITFGLPDGSEVTITDEDAPDSFSELSIGDGEGLRLTWNDVDDGNRVGIMIGLGLDTDLEGDAEADIAGDALFALARIDPDGDHPLGVDTYMVSGNETDTLPASGHAVYKGRTIATLISNLGGVAFDVADHMTGKATITAHFLPQSVDVHLKGEGSETSGPDGYYSYDVYANDLPMDGSRYGGEIEGTVEFSACNSPCFEVEIDVAGDLLGAFYGDDAEATAGVFGAEGTSPNDVDYELVGGYAAYQDQPEE